MRRILHAPFSQVNTPFLRTVNSGRVENVWRRIEVELATRKDAASRPEAWLAAKLKLKIQVVHNWKSRGVPPRRHKAIADALGWPVGRLLGVEPAPVAYDWPFELISRQQWEALSERQRGAVEAAAIKALRDLPETPASSNTKDPPTKRH
jgi:hypothetical protein